MTVRRFDASPITARRDPAGFLRGTANLTRTGVLAYRNADGSVRRELRHPDEVFKADSLSTLSLVPMTLGHPSDGMPVTARTAKRSVVGAIGDTVKQDGRFVRAPYVIHDDAAIGEVESGRQRELSCGYNCDLDNTPGVFEGEAYDSVQRNIRYNHVAILPRGRAGSEVRIDCADVEEFPFSPDTQQSQQATRFDTMKTIRIDGIDLDVTSPAFDQAWQKFLLTNEKTITDLRTENATLKTEADKQRGRADGLDTEIEKLKKESAPDAITKKINERVALVAKATKVLGSKYNADGKSDDEIKRAVILKVVPAAKLDGQSADYVSARFDHVIESYKTDAASQSIADVRTDLAEADDLRADEDDALDDTKAQEEMRKRNRDAWKNK